MSDCSIISEALKDLRDKRGLRLESCQGTNLRLRVESGVHLNQALLSGQLELDCAHMQIRVTN
jgi:hypothetical protein